MFPIQFDITVFILGVSFCILELLKYKKTNLSYHKMYILFSTSIVLASFSFILMKLLGWQYIFTKSLVFTTPAFLFIIIAFFFGLKGMKLEKIEKKQGHKQDKA